MNPVAHRREGDADTHPERQTPALAGPTPPARVPRLRVRVASGPQAGRMFEAADDHVTIGTHRTCDLVLDDESVSRFHCEIEVDGGRARVRDLDSTNGTFVDGMQVIEAYLGGNSQLRLGRTEIAVEVGGGQVDIPRSSRERFGGMVGRSPAMQQVFTILERAAASEATVLLEGETGTGKDAAAESIHREGRRAAGPFVVVDCGAIPAELLESELFGHEKGAFTGAIASHEGAFQAASGGSIFLDEVGELSPDLQPKLLRALERHEVKRVGSTRYLPVDVRVIAATNRSLRSDVNAKHFRADLYYRLAVVRVRMPPLRERVADLPLLVDELLGRVDGIPAGVADTLRTPAFVDELARHRWPGNVRELRNIIEESALLASGEVITATHLGPWSSGEPVPVAPPPASSAPEGFPEAGVDLEQLERRLVEQALAKADWNVTRAAKLLNLTRDTLRYRIEKFGLAAPSAE
jgi:two-component system, NtrC family, response regulator GlrR